jgi:hypothetical protein
MPSRYVSFFIGHAAASKKWIAETDRMPVSDPKYWNEWRDDDFLF